MKQSTNPTLEPGRVYRTREFAAWTKNPPRLAKRLVRDGVLVPLARGLFVHPRRGRFGSVSPSDTALMRSFLGETQFVFTGPNRWNALGLGTTAVSPTTVVYNRKRTGRFLLSGRPFELRRVAFPDNPDKEWFVVDLLENAELASVSRTDVADLLKRAVKEGQFDVARLREMAGQYGTKETQGLLKATLEATAA